MIKKRNLRTQEIESKLTDIVESISKVQENLPKDFNDFLNLDLAKDEIYKKIEFSIESIIDICNIINSDLRLGTPETEEGIIDNLGRNIVFEKKVIDLIKEMRGFRNILVHKYGKTDDKKAFHAIKEGLKDFEIIIVAIERFLKGHGKGQKRIRK